ncbi:MAG: hypothetical protein FJ221_18365 [Lentisphaerae bacterium]|nr:hypothetical protein [Lentisphaerota bacterium]
MKPTLTLLTALLLAPLAAMHAGRNLPGVPTFGELRAGSFQALENTGHGLSMPGTDEQMKTKGTKP